MNKTALQDHISKLRSAHGFAGDLRDRLDECRSLMLAFEREESLILQQFEHRLKQSSSRPRRIGITATGLADVKPDQQLAALLSRVSFDNMIKKSKLSVLESQHRNSFTASRSPSRRVQPRLESPQQQRQNNTRCWTIKDAKAEQARNSSLDREVDSLSRLKAYEHNLANQLELLREENEKQQMDADTFTHKLEVLVRDKGVVLLRICDVQKKLKRLEVATTTQLQMDFSHKLAQVFEWSSESD